MLNQIDANEFEIGQVLTVANTEVFRNTIRRVSDKCFEVTYFDQPTNDEILKACFTVDGRIESVWFDRSYWATTIDGRRATEYDIQELFTKTGWGFQANPVSGELSVTCCPQPLCRSEANPAP